LRIITQPAAISHAASGDQRAGAEAELVGTQQSTDHDVTAGAQTTVHLDGDTAAQVVTHQGLMGLGQADFPR